MELDYKAIGKRIKIARIKTDLTQEKLSEMVGVSPTHMSNVETGTTRVSLTTIVRIANALGITSDDLLCDKLIALRVSIVPFIREHFTDIQIHCVFASLSAIINCPNSVNAYQFVRSKRLSLNRPLVSTRPLTSRFSA